MKRFFIRLHILIPLIIAGLCLLAYLVGGRVYHQALQYRQAAWMFTAWGAGLTITAFVIGLLITRRLLQPMEEFARRATLALAGRRKNRPQPANEQPQPAVSELDAYQQVFSDVSDLIGQETARERFPEIIAQSRVMRGILGQVLKVAATEATVLITGESGTGKELIAAGVHEQSDRQGGPLVKLNCTAIPRELLESELFGHEKGAFTGATSARNGRFEQAQGGTLFLDEIGDLSLDLQVKLLRVLQEKEFQRLGGNRTIKADVRIIAATNHDLAAKVDDGSFREDLYYRLNVFPIHLPPLRDRREDIPLLAEHFLATRHPGSRLTDEALGLLLAHSWPGNVRELFNVLERAAIMAADQVIHPEHLPPAITVGLARHLQTLPALPEEADLDQKLARLEQALIVEALRQSNGVQAKAAQLLGIKPRSLWHRIKKYDIDPRQG